MTTEELNTIVQAVIAELEKSGVDFDYKAEQAEDDDLVFVIRGTAPDYSGKVVTWKNFLDLITAKAEQAKTDAVDAKVMAENILSQVTTKESNVSTMKSDVSAMKASVETTKTEVETLKAQAESAKETAVQKASEAGQSASDASSSAQNASASESNALTYKTQAETANTKAQQALSDTTAAKDIAVEAKTDVENMKASVVQTVSDFNTLAAEKKAEIESVYQTDLEAERNARIEADTDHSTRLQKVELKSSVNRYEIENLKAKAEGQIYREEIVDGEAYTLDVPSSVSPYAEVQRIGGKSVVWNQLVNARFSSPQSNISNNGTLSKTDSYTKVNSIPSTNRIALGTSTNINIVDGHIYYFHSILKVNGFSDNVTVNSELDSYLSITPRPVCPNNVWTNWDILFTTTIGMSFKQIFLFYIDSAYTDDTKELYVKEFSCFDLTLMFGSKNEPTLEECKKIFSADYYPYDAGTLKSFPVKRVKSVGSNLINPTMTTTTINGVTCRNNGDGTYTVNGTASADALFYLCQYTLKAMETYKLVGCPKGGSDTTYYLNPAGYSFDTGNGVSIFRNSNIDWNETIIIIIKSGTTVSNLLFKPMLTQDLTATYDNFKPYREPIMLDVSSATSDLKSAGSVHDEWNDGKKIKRVGERAYTSGDESESNYITDGTTTYYPLDTPTEETIPKIDNYIKVEGGGTLTFESDETIHMPVPSTDRFVVDLT